VTPIDADAMESYRLARDEVTASLRRLQQLLPAEAAQEIDDERARLERESFVVAVVGEFSSGKSFLLNALLGKIRLERTGTTERIVGLLATDINPSTAAITELQYGREECAYAFYADGRQERIPLDRLSHFIAVGADEGMLHAATGDEAAAPTRVVIDVDSPFLQRGFSLADTPGLASINPAHRRATLSFLPSADAVLYLIDTQQPFTEGDAAFLGIIRRHIQSIFIVQTKIDLWQMPQNGSTPAWESAQERIASLAAIHSPGTYVHAVSARDYAEGRLHKSEELIAQSRFNEFVGALDASLVATTGRTRLSAALARVERVVSGASAQLERDLEMPLLSKETLQHRRSELVPELESRSLLIRGEQEQIREARLRVSQTARGQGAELYEELKSTLERAFDTADIARLQDRAKLHIIIDGTIAEVVGHFAATLAADVVSSLNEIVERSQQFVDPDFSVSSAGARAFGASVGAGAWSGEAAGALRATIVLQAVGSIAMDIVADIAQRFTAMPKGQYMKRELSADLREHLFPRLDNEIKEFVESLTDRVALMFDDLSACLSKGERKQREDSVGSIDRALQASSRSLEVAGITQRLENDRRQLGAEFDRIAASVGAFLERNATLAPAQTGPEEIRRAHTELTAFDESAYDRGLRPERWRVCVLGALRRGKSSLINAIAGSRVLHDETAGEIAFPVHVRYGPIERAHSLSGNGEWTEVEIESALDEATRNPVLIETPWQLPRQLVLVHAPAFDMGDGRTAEICMVAARAASEVLCLFSRQLSERELIMYGRVADLNKPMTFVHTLADNEASQERRDVVELAWQYLKQRNIAPHRIFTISTFEHMQAKRAGRAPAGWNELEALSATLSVHAEEHMQRLARLDRIAEGTKAKAPASATQAPKSPALLRSLRRFFKGR